MQEKISLQIVADTNVLVSALLGKTLRWFIEYLKVGKFDLLFSEQTYEELFFVLTRPKFKKYLTSKEIAELADLLTYPSAFVTPTVTLNDCRDPKDNIFLECATTGQVSFIV